MIPLKYVLITSLLLSINTIGIFGQVPVVTTPRPGTLSPGVNIGFPANRNNPAPNIPALPGFNNNNQQQLDMVRRDMLEVQRRNAEMQRMSNGDSEYFSSNWGIRYELPSCVGMPGTEYFYQTAEKLLDMLSGKTPLNLKEAVFSVENAYFEGNIDRTKYEKAISELVTIAQVKAKQDGLNWNNPTTKNIMLFRVMSDTLKLKLPARESSTVSYPMQYDFDDFWAKEDITKLFVTKLLASHSGQCHSLPLLYLILCEATGAEANLTFSPMHSYIKFKDRQGNWNNLELTIGRIVTDAFIIGSGFITTEAIKNGLYMEPQTKKQAIAHCLNDLAMYYERKYGYDKFLIQCADSALKYAPGNFSILAMKSNYHSAHFEYTARQAGWPPQDTLKVHYPRIYELYEERNNFYQKIDNMGYREMPKDIYEVWLRSLDEEKERREHDEKYHKILQFAK
ncbi:MAG: hypothetical protein LBI82_04595 [Dysgonamonadaceae bacterium]|jgi:hypothetical protein|nr:hypothetical protein [Dysgonamonadaceae bacterium]